MIDITDEEYNEWERLLRLSGTVTDFRKKYIGVKKRYTESGELRYNLIYSFKQLWRIFLIIEGEVFNVTLGDIYGKD